MQSIVTKFIGPSNYLGSRVKATSEAGRVTTPYDHELSLDENHVAAARALCKKFGCHGSSGDRHRYLFLRAKLPNGEHVFINTESLSGQPVDGFEI